MPRLITVGVLTVALCAALTGPVLGQGTGGQFCVQVSDTVEAEELNEQVAEGRVEISVVADSECADGTAFDALSDAEHFGLFAGHQVGQIVPMLGRMEEALLAVAEDADDIETARAVIDGVIASFDTELAWFEAHPPRPCYIGRHEALRGFFEDGADLFGKFATAISGEPDAVMIAEVTADLQALDVQDAYAGAPEPTCWVL